MRAWEDSDKSYKALDELPPLGPQAKKRITAGAELQGITSQNQCIRINFSCEPTIADEVLVELADILGDRRDFQSFVACDFRKPRFAEVSNQTTVAPGFATIRRNSLTIAIAREGKSTLSPSVRNPCL